MLMTLKKVSSIVTPAQAGVQKCLERLDSRLRGNDKEVLSWTSCEAVNVESRISRQAAWLAKIFP
jgi:hypothetical protein